MKNNLHYLTQLPFRRRPRGMLGLGLGLWSRAKRESAALLVDNLVANWDMVAGANTQRVYNKKYAGARTNLLLESNDFTYWSVYLATRIKNAVTFTASADAICYHGVQGYTIGQNGNYTVTCEAKMATGTGKFRLGIYNESAGGLYLSSDLDLTDAWQTFTFTYSVPGVVGQSVDACLCNATDGAGRTVQVRNVRLNRGAADLGQENMPQWDGCLGQTYDVEASYDPEFTSLGIDCGDGTTKAVSVYGNNGTLAEFTIYALFKWTGDPAVANDCRLFSASKAELFASYLKPWPGRYDGSGRYAYGAYLKDSAWHVLAVSCTATGLSIYVDGVKMDEHTYTTSAFSAESYASLAGYFTAGFPGVVASMLLYSAAHTAAQVASNTTALDTLVAKARGVSVSRFTNFAVVDGDSFAERTTGVDYLSKAPWISCNAQTPFLFHRNFALSGQRIDQRHAAAATGVDLYARTGSGKNICILWCGANDLAQGVSGADIWAKYRTYCLARKAAGFSKVVMLNMLPEADAGRTAVRNEVNGLLAADHSFCDALVDVAADATIGPDAAGSNTDYYGDGVHPTAATHTIVAGLLTTALSGLLA